MEKGIYFGNGLEFYKDLPWLVERGFTAVFLHGDFLSLRHKMTYCMQWNVAITIVSIAGNDWKDIVDEIDSKYYYVDEPYSMEVITDEQIKERLDYIKIKRPGSKFVIGDIREIQKDSYVPIKDLYYTYTSYTNNWYIPYFGIAVPFGLGNQSPSIKRIHKKVEGRFPFMWVYGQNKLLCHPDEYHKLKKTCDDLGIEMMILYLGDGPEGKYKFNTVSEHDLMENIHHFLNDTRPYTINLWIRRLNHRLRLSINELIKNKNLKEFIEHLF